MVADVVRKYKLFPAYAGVILIELNGYNVTAAFPRIRGGAPYRYPIEIVEDAFSPHMRGQF